MEGNTSSSMHAYPYYKTIKRNVLEMKRMKFGTTQYRAIRSMRNTLGDAIDLEIKICRNEDRQVSRHLFGLHVSIHFTTEENKAPTNSTL